MSDIDMNMESLFDELQTLRAAGKGTEAEEKLKDAFEKLPTDVQEQILVDMFKTSMNTYTENFEAMRNMQYDGLRAAFMLQATKKRSKLDK